MIVLMLSALVLLAATTTLHADLDRFVQKTMDTLGTPPGLAVVVVQDDRVVYRGDFGLRDAEAKLPVTPDTRFYVASSTKAFTAMAALLAAENGTVDLDAPVTTYWPALKLTAPLDPDRLSLRDFLAMRSGVRNSTYNYRASIVGNIDDEGELTRILAVYSQEQPRTFEYSNMSYAVAAEVLERAAGKTWQQLTAEMVFAPLGMRAATTEVPSDGVPVAHFYRSTAPGVFERRPEKTNATMGPAGGTFLTTSDAAKWIIAMLNDGRIDGRQALPSRAVRAAQSFQTTQKQRHRWFDRWGWGFGQDLGEYDGELFVHRFGGFHGAYSHISWMPDRRIGVAVFSNGGGAAADAVAAYVYDRMLGLKDVDAKWAGELAELARSERKKREEWRKASEVLATRGTPGHPLATYTGRYRSDRLGEVEVELVDGRLWAQQGVLRAELAPAGGDEFRIDWTAQGRIEPLTYSFDPAGHPTGFDWDGRPFDRVP